MASCRPRYLGAIVEQDFIGSRPESMLSSSCGPMATVLNTDRDLTSGKDPLPASVPNIQNAHLAAVYYGQRCSGDFYDFVRVNRDCVLFGLFDIAGGLHETRSIMCQVQNAFRTLGIELLQAPDGNVAESMLELWIRLNNTVMKAANGVHSCPAFFGCYN